MDHHVKKTKKKKKKGKTRVAPMIDPDAVRKFQEQVEKQKQKHDLSRTGFYGNAVGMRRRNSMSALSSASGAPSIQMSWDLNSTDSDSTVSVEEKKKKPRDNKVHPSEFNNTVVTKVKESTSYSVFTASAFLPGMLEMHDMIDTSVDFEADPVGSRRRSKGSADVPSIEDLNNSFRRNRMLEKAAEGWLANMNKPDILNAVEIDTSDISEVSA